MGPKDFFTRGYLEGHAKVGRAPRVVHSAMASPVGSQARAMPLGRFLLSSTGFHLILAWIIISIGLPKVPSDPRPLVVTLIDSGGSEPAAPAGRSARAGTDPRPTPRRAASPANVEAIAKPAASLPSVARTAEAGEPATLDERVTPKTVGMPSGGSQVGGVVFAAGNLSPGPVLLGSDGGSEVGSGSGGRGGVGRLDPSLVAVLTPSVTIGFPHGSGGGGPGWAGNGADGGRFSAPNYGVNPLPQYPRVAREKGYEGTVYLRVLVRADGRVEQLAVDRSSGYEILDRTAVDSVKGWAFFPAKKSGKPVESWVLLPVKFALN